MGQVRCVKDRSWRHGPGAVCDGAQLAAWATRHPHPTPATPSALWRCPPLPPPALLGGPPHLPPPALLGGHPLPPTQPLTIPFLLLLPIAGGQRSPLRVMHGPVQARRPCSPGTAELVASTPTQQAQVLRPGQCYSLKGRMVRCVKGRSRRHGRMMRCVKRRSWLHAAGAVCEGAQLAACARCSV